MTVDLKPKLVCDIAPKENSIRNSEGAFLKAPNGDILFAYSCFTDDAWDHSPSNIKMTRSSDNGETWSAPITTGIQGQASSLCALGGEKLLAIHAIRRDTDRPGIYGYVVDFSEKTWKIVDEALLWEPAVPMIKDSKMAEIFSFVKFGQPIAIKLADGSLLLSFWFAQEGQYKTVCMPVEL